MALVQQILPDPTPPTDAALALGFALLTALAAQVVVPMPFASFPISGQSCAVLLSGALLGMRRGILSMALYLGLGAVGLPFFAGGSSGVLILFESTGSSGASYLLTVAVVGWYAERGWDRTFLRMLPVMLLGEAVLRTCSVLGLGLALRWPSSLLQLSLWPFLSGDLVKLLAAALTVRWLLWLHEWLVARS